MKPTTVKHAKAAAQRNTEKLVQLYRAAQDCLAQLCGLDTDDGDPTWDEKDAIELVACSTTPTESCAWLPPN